MSEQARNYDFRKRHLGSCTLGDPTVVLDDRNCLECEEQRERRVYSSELRYVLDGDILSSFTAERTLVGSFSPAKGKRISPCWQSLMKIRQVMKLVLHR